MNDWRWGRAHWSTRATYGFLPLLLIVFPSLGEVVSSAVPWRRVVAALFVLGSVWSVRRIGVWLEGDALIVVNQFASKKRIPVSKITGLRTVNPILSPNGPLYLALVIDEASQRRVVRVASTAVWSRRIRHWYGAEFSQLPPGPSEGPRLRYEDWGFLPISG